MFQHFVNLCIIPFSHDQFTDIIIETDQVPVTSVTAEHNTIKLMDVAHDTSGFL